MRRIASLVIVGLSALIAVLGLVAEVGCPACGQAKAAASDAEPVRRSAFRSQNLSTGYPYSVTLPLVFRYYDPTYVSPFGIVMYGNVDDAAGLHVMKEAGAKSATTIFYWSAVQPKRGDNPNWSSFDTKAQNAQAAGLDLFVLFTGNPSWAAEYPGSPVTDMQDLVSFVTAMVERYDCDGIQDAPGHPCIRYWSFYAEPDNGDPGHARYGGKGLWGHNGAGYAAMLAAIAPAIHTADPKAKVLIGGLAYDWFEESGGPFVRSFLADTLAALNTYPGGASRYLDAVAFHYYPIGVWPTIREKAMEIRGIMASHGAGNLPLLSPEMGYWSSPKYGSSELGQAYWLVQDYVRGLSVDIRLLSWYKVFDDAVASSPEDSAQSRTAGLLRVDGTLKPAYLAYQTMSRELAMARYVGPYQASGVEGYVFTTAEGGQKTVLWSKAGLVHVAFPYTHLRVVTATGDAVFDILDNQRQLGAPGDVDGGIAGQIELELHENQPFYVERK
jgi:hypothetical protein